MPKHRNSERLPDDLIDQIKASPYSEFFGNVLFIRGGGFRRFGWMPSGGAIRIKPWQALDVQYTLRDGIISRTEFLRGEPAIPVHIANYDAETGKRFAVIIDRF